MLTTQHGRLATASSCLAKTAQPRVETLGHLRRFNRLRTAASVWGRACTAGLPDTRPARTRCDVTQRDLQYSTRPLPGRPVPGACSECV